MYANNDATININIKRFSQIQSVGTKLTPPRNIRKHFLTPHNKSQFCNMVAPRTHRTSAQNRQHSSASSSLAIINLAREFLARVQLILTKRLPLSPLSASNPRRNWAVRAQYYS